MVQLVQSRRGDSGPEMESSWQRNSHSGKEWRGWRLGGREGGRGQWRREIVCVYVCMSCVCVCEGVCVCIFLTVRKVPVLL